VFLRPLDYLSAHATPSIFTDAVAERTRGHPGCNARLSKRWTGAIQLHYAR
jgi:hypothetical protein